MTIEQMIKHINQHFDFRFGQDPKKISKSNMILIFKEKEVSHKNGKTIGWIEKFK